MHNWDQVGDVPSGLWLIRRLSRDTKVADRVLADPLNHSCVDSVKLGISCMFVGDSQRVVNTVSVRSEGHCNGLSNACEVFNTNCDDWLDQGFKVVPEDIKDSNTDTPILTRCWEVEEGTGQIEDVQGRLKHYLSFWEKELDPAPWILSCIQEGYKLPLRSIPDRYYKPNLP